MPNVVQELFTLTEAQALQGKQVWATREYRDEHDRILIPLGLDAWDEQDRLNIE